jgi:nucleotide-binding universal stress UspA family protein
MSDVILVVLGRPAAAPAVLSAAACLASLMGGARLNVIVVQQPVHIHALEAEALVMEADAILALRHGDEKRIAALEGTFRRWVAEAGEAVTAARWSEVEGSAATVIAERGSRADIIVAEQPAEDDRWTRQVIRAALFGTGRPVLVIPPGAAMPFGRRIAIAWRDEKQAARAVIPALRWLAGAAQVHVLVGLHEGRMQPAMPRVFVEHGIGSELHVLPIKPGPFGRTLLAKAKELGADLLVMGAYAHSPLRELILGGVTKYMLDHANLPVLMRH